jgi:hypothetical protein
MAKRVTIFDPPALDDSKAAIENILELTPILDIGPVCLIPKGLCCLQFERTALLTVVRSKSRMFSPTPGPCGILPVLEASTAVP